MLSDFKIFILIRVVVVAVKLYSHTLTSSTAADFLEVRDPKITLHDMQVLEAIYKKALRSDLFDLVGRGLELFQRIFAIYPLPNINYINMPLCLLIKIVKMLGVSILGDI